MNEARELLRIAKSLTGFGTRTEIKVMPSGRDEITVRIMTEITRVIFENDAKTFFREAEAQRKKLRNDILDLPDVVKVDLSQAPFITKYREMTLVATLIVTIDDLALGDAVLEEIKQLTV